MPKRLHIGCGDNIKPGWVNCDVAALPGVDVVWNLREFPWPFEDDEFSEVLAENVLEHVPDTVKTLEEIHRICREGARVTVTVPYWNSYEAHTDPTHVRSFNEFSFDFFDPSKDRCRNRPYYSTARFRIERLGMLISFLRPYIRIPLLSREVVFYGNFSRWFLGLVGNLFGNIITGLNIELRAVKSASDPGLPAQ